MECSSFKICTCMKSSFELDLILVSSLKLQSHSYGSWQIFIAILFLWYSQYTCTFKCDFAFFHCFYSLVYLNKTPECLRIDGNLDSWVELLPLNWTMKPGNYFNVRTWILCYEIDWNKLCGIYTQLDLGNCFYLWSLLYIF